MLDVLAGLGSPPPPSEKRRGKIIDSNMQGTIGQILSAFGLGIPMLGGTLSQSGFASGFSPGAPIGFGLPIGLQSPIMGNWVAMHNMINR